MSKYLITLEVEGKQAFSDLMNNNGSYEVIHTEEIESE